MFSLDKFKQNMTPEVRTALGMGLLSGGDASQQWANGAQALGGAVNNQRQTRQDAAKINKTVEFLKGVNPQLAQAVEAGALSAGDAYGQHLRAQTPKSPSFGKSPIYGTDAQGKMVLGTVGDDGSFRQIDTGGFTPSSGVTELDLGDRFAIQNKRNGEIIGYEEKNLANAEAQKVVGKELGADLNTLSDMESSMGGLEDVVSQLDQLAETATYTYAGQASDFARTQMGLAPSEGAKARTQYIAMVDNQILPLLRQTFGAAFTAKEGESLKATLGAPDKSPEEKQRVLKAFIEQKKRNLNAQRVKAGVAPSVDTGNGSADIQSLIDQYAD